jgi:hypothetical protein
LTKDHESVTEVDVGVSVLEISTFCGAAGNIVMVTGFEGTDWPPDNEVELSAVIVIVYVWPGRSPLVIDTGVVELAIVCELLMLYVPAKPVLVPTAVINVLADTPLPFMRVPTTNLPYMTLVTVSVVPEICPTKATPRITRGVAVVPTIVEIPVMVGAPVEDTALYV